MKTVYFSATDSQNLSPANRNTRKETSRSPAHKAPDQQRAKYLTEGVNVEAILLRVLADLLQVSEQIMQRQAVLQWNFRLLQDLQQLLSSLRGGDVYTRMTSVWACRSSGMADTLSCLLAEFCYFLYTELFRPARMSEKWHIPDSSCTAAWRSV